MRYFNSFALTALLLCGCRGGDRDAPRGEPGEVEQARGDERGDEDDQRKGDEAGERDLEVDELVGRGTRTPFGLALDVNVDEATLLYPTLIAFGAPSAELAKHLPQDLGGRTREVLIHGVQEGLDAAWVGGIARYSGPEGNLWVMVQDAGWEPTTLNPLHEGWRSGNQDPLPDGRPVSDVPPPESEGVFLQAPVSSAGGARRIVVQAHGPEGTDEGVLRSLLAAIPPGPLAALEASTTGRTGPYPRAPKLPGADVLGALADPAALAAALPSATPDGWTVVGEGWGWRREASRNVLAGAWRVFGTPNGVLVASIQDLGDPKRPVVLDWSGGGTSGGTADEIRKSVGKSRKTRCSDFFASCKWAKLMEDRLVLSAFGPMADGKEATDAIAQAFDAAAAEAAVRGR